MSHVVQFRVINPDQSFSDPYKPATKERMHMATMKFK